MCTVDVADIDATTKRIAEVGGHVVVPKMPTPTVGWLAYSHDTDGNIFGVIQMDGVAK